MRFDNFPFSPILIHARWILGKLPSEELPLLAQKGLELGYDGEAIRRIAGLLRPNYGDLEPLIGKFFSELGAKTELSIEEAGWFMARSVAEAILQGTVSPYEGARFIWRDLVNEIWPNQQHPLLCFVGNASEYEDCASYSLNSKETRREIEQDIINDARTLIAANS